jgi:hypothetical protein
MRHKKARVCPKNAVFYHLIRVFLTGFGRFLTVFLPIPAAPAWPAPDAAPPPIVTFMFQK